MAGGKCLVKIMDDDPIRFIEHQGKKILLVDFTNADAHDMLLLLEELRTMVAQHPRGSLVILSEFAGATVDHEVATKIKEVLTRDRPFVKKTAWVGTESIPHAFMENFHNFSQREIATFKTREEAMDWLVAE
jgi:hypothetical protein